MGNQNFDFAWISDLIDLILILYWIPILEFWHQISLLFYFNLIYLFINLIFILSYCYKVSFVILRNFS